MHAFLKCSLGRVLAKYFLLEKKNSNLFKKCFFVGFTFFPFFSPRSNSICDCSANEKSAECGCFSAAEVMKTGSSASAENTQ